MSRVHTEAPSANVLSFARETASSSVSNEWTVTAGPKISSRSIAASGCGLQDDGRLVGGAVARATARQDLAAGLLDSAGEFRALSLGDQRGDLLVRAERRGTLHEAAHELVVDRPLDEDPLCAHAHLPGAGERCEERALHGAVEIGVGEDDERILPPSSSTTGQPRAPAAAATRRPTAAEPVKKILAMRASATSASPTGDLAVHDQTRPGGAPASSSTRRTHSPHAGVSSEGFSTTPLPAATAVATLVNGMAKGTFQGEITPTTPYGSYLSQARLCSSWGCLYRMRRGRSTFGALRASHEAWSSAAKRS